MSAQTAARNTIALVYDFDGTLSPQPMQEYTILPQLGVSPAAFWDEVNRQCEAGEAEPMLVYLRRLLEVAAEQGAPLRRESFQGLGAQIELFPGVADWFGHIEERVTELSGGQVAVAHYVVSAGLQEILESVPIARHFRRIYASSYHYDAQGCASFPRVLVTDTTKTQFLFRINKGRENLRDNINSHMPLAHRPVPFSQMIYLGDGETDVPSMAVTRQNGGYAIAVHTPGSAAKRAVCEDLLEAGRVNFFAPADFRAGERLESLVDVILRAIVAQIRVRDTR